MVAYHDTEWGVPCFDDKILFEYFVLDTFQAGLSWQIVLNKRAGFARAFANFDPVQVAAFTQSDWDRLRNDAGIIRNRAKIAACTRNAQAFLAVQREYGQFAKFLWGFVNGTPIQNHWREDRDIPAATPLSDNVSQELKARGFSFCGTTIVYAFLQAAGLVNDHVEMCFRHQEVAQLRR